MHKMGTRVLNTLTSLLPSIVDLPYFPLTESEMAGLLIYPYGYVMYPHVHVMDLKDRDRIEVRPGGDMWKIPNELFSFPPPQCLDIKFGN